MATRQNNLNLRGAYASTVPSNETGGSTPPTSNLWGWWSAEAAFSSTGGGGSLVTTSGSNVASLYDLSLNGRHLDQSTVGNQPKYLPNSLGNKPSILFNGTDQFLSNASSPTGAISVYMILKQVGWTDDDVLLHFDGSTVFEFWQDGTSPTLKLFTTGGQTASLQTFELGRFGIVSGVANGSLSNISLNNETSSFSTLATVDAGATLYLGRSPAGYYSNFALCEILAYSTAHSASFGDGLAVRQYLNNKYGLRIFAGDVGLLNDFTIDTQGGLPVEITSGSRIGGFVEFSQSPVYCPSNGKMFVQDTNTSAHASSRVYRFHPTGSSNDGNVNLSYLGGGQGCYVPSVDRIFFAGGSTSDLYKLNPHNLSYSSLGINTNTIYACCYVPSTDVVIALRYAASSTDLYVRNPSTGASIAAVNIGSTTKIGPYAIVYCPTTDRVYIPLSNNSSTSDLVIFNPSNNTVETTLTNIFTNPSTSYSTPAFCPTNGYIYFGGTGGNPIAVFDPVKKKVVSEFMVSTVDGAQHICYDPKRDLICTANHPSTNVGYVSLIDPKTNVVVKRILWGNTSGTCPDYVTYNPMNGFVYVSNLNGPTLSILG
jgi:hypothetical protein